jgi:hypothetical protein
LKISDWKAKFFEGAFSGSARSSEVALEVYDMLGRQVVSKSLGVRQPGEHAVSFNALGLASGSYFYRLKMVANGAIVTGKMMLLK